MAYAEAIKKRSVAKGQFTRICTSISTAVDQSKPLELIDLHVSDLKAAYDVICARHADVVLHEGPADDNNDEWIAEIEQRYDGVREMVLNHKTHSKANQNNASRQLQEKRDDEAKQLLVIKAHILRGVQKADYRQLCEGISKSVEHNSVEAVKSGKADLGRLMEEVKTAHVNYIAMLPADQADGENVWLQPIRELYDNTNDAIGKFLDGHTTPLPLRRKSSLASTLRRCVYLCLRVIFVNIPGSGLILRDLFRLKLWRIRLRLSCADLWAGNHCKWLEP